MMTTGEWKVMYSRGGKVSALKRAEAKRKSDSGCHALSGR